MATYREMQIAIGQTVTVRFEDLTVKCLITDVKASWGKMRLQVKPVAGDGTQWVEMGRVLLAASTREELMRMPL